MKMTFTMSGQILLFENSGLLANKTQKGKTRIKTNFKGFGYPPPISTGLMIRSPTVFRI